MLPPNICVFHAFWYYNERIIHIILKTRCCGRGSAVPIAIPRGIAIGTALKSSEIFEVRYLVCEDGGQQFVACRKFVDRIPAWAVEPTERTVFSCDHVDVDISSANDGRRAPCPVILVHHDEVQTRLVISGERRAVEHDIKCRTVLNFKKVYIIIRDGEAAGRLRFVAKVADSSVAS